MRNASEVPLARLTRSFRSRALQLRACGDQSLAGLVAFVLDEVLDEAGSEVLGLDVPLGSVGVGVARVEDFGGNASQLGGDLKIEVRQLLGRSLVDIAVQDGVDDAAGVLDGDALAGAVPAGVDQIGLCAALFHLLDELFGVLGRMQLEEGLAEAGGERRGRLGDATLGAGQLRGEAGEEVVLRLLRGQDGNGRQNAEGICGQEDDVLRSGRRGDRADNVLNVVDRVGNTGVLGNALVSEIDLSVCVQSNVLKKSISLDCIVDIRLRFLVERDVLEQRRSSA